MRIYLLIGSAGEYSDRLERVVAAYVNEIERDTIYDMCLVHLKNQPPLLQYHGFPYDKAAMGRWEESHPVQDAIWCDSFDRAEVELHGVN